MWHTMTKRLITRKVQCRSCLTKQVCTLYCIFINYSNSLTYCAFFYGKTGTKMSYNHATCSLQTWRHASCTDDPSSRRPLPGCLVPIVNGAGRSDQPIGHVGLRDFLSLGRSQRIVNSSVSFIHSPSNAGLQVTGSRYVT